MQHPNYRIVKLVNGTHSVHSLAESETFHPVVGPAAEAEALYVRQLQLVQRAAVCATRGEEFVIWDVGLGAAANPLTFLQSAGLSGCHVRIVSFDHTLEPLAFALNHPEHLPYLQPFLDPLRKLIQEQSAQCEHRGCQIDWTAHVSDFPTLISSAWAESLPKPHAIMFDAFSPAKNPTMWCLPVFRRIFQLLDPQRACALPTYSRSTILRVTLLLSGFYVGVGQPIGDKEETTIAANSLSLLAQPLDDRWLARVRRSSSAEPLWEPIYRQAPLSSETWEELLLHPQFKDAVVQKEPAALRNTNG